MPNKYPVKKGWDVPKQKYKVTNWPDYNAALCQRGEMVLSKLESNVIRF